MNVQIVYDMIVIISCTSHIALSFRRFKDGGAEKLLNEKKRTVTVVAGQEAKLKWVFQTSKKITFHGIAWTITDRLFKNSTKLLWMARDERLYRHLHTKNRPDYDVRLTSETIKNSVQLTIVIPNVQRIHENKYICHVIGFHIGPFEIKLKVKDVLNSTLSNGNKTTINPTNSTTEMTKPNNIRARNRSSTILIGFYSNPVPTIQATPLFHTTARIFASELSTSSGLNFNLRSSIILITFSALLIIFVLVGILIYKRLRRRRQRQRNARSSVGSTDTQKPIISHRSAHENRRISIEANRLSRSDEFLFESARTGFSYEDSVGSISFHGIMPVHFTRIPQHENTQNEFNVGNYGALRSYEIDRCLLQDMVTIGEGAFGVVARATLLKETNSAEKQIVAVKMLKAFASPEDKQDLMSELDIMSRVGSHRNVVGLIGCVTKSGPVCVIIEYVSRGDLLGFLRKTRGLVDTTYAVQNHIPQSQLSQCQLLRMACNVAMGMDHLSRNQVIHRDLAARNVLVGENLECKITDFGMARNVNATDYYRKRSRGRIPLKWTAIEALVDEKYTTKSDVWSFGILLYEIVTMGGKPYPGMGVGQLLRKLKSGWRMSKPAHVDTSLYEIMLKCWSSSPDARPSFSILAKTFTNFINATSDYINISDYDGSLYLDMGENSSSHSDNEINV